MLIQYENLLKRYLDEKRNLPLNDFPLTQLCSLDTWKHNSAFQPRYD